MFVIYLGLIMDMVACDLNDSNDSGVYDKDCHCDGYHGENYHHSDNTGIIEEKNNPRISSLSNDLKKPLSDAEFIKKALTKEISDHSSLIASSRRTVPVIRVNGVLISEKAIGEEVQYHPAHSQDEALFLAAQALVIRELLHQAVMVDEELSGLWMVDEEEAIGRLIAKHVQPKEPTMDNCWRYYQANRSKFTTPPVVDVRHILLASPPEEGEERIKLKEQAHNLIKTIKKASNSDATFTMFAMQYSACPSKTEGGRLGVLQSGSTVPEFEQAVFGLAQGLAINPIATRYGIHIVDIISRIDGQELSFDKAYPVIQNELTQQSFHHALVDYLFTLKQNADIEGIDIDINQKNVYRD